MAVLGRLKVAPNQRLDLPDIVAFDAYSAGDWKGFLEAMVDDKPYLIKGFEVFQPNTLIGNPAGSVDIVVNGSSLWWANGGEGSFFVSLPAAENKSVTLITDATNYIEMSLTLSSRAQDARALWDPGANGGNGGEFTQVVDTESYLDVEVTRNNTGFSEDKIPIAKVVVNVSNNVLSITDCRPMLFRLGSGGNTPDPLNDYIWRDDPAGFDREDTPTTMSSPSDPNVFRGADKNIRSFKEWMDAVMSRLKEIDGGSKWFQATGGGGGGSGGALSLTNLFLDSQAGHSPLPDRKVTMTWSKVSDNKLRSENAVSYSAPVRWGANFGQLRWQAGGSFVSSSNRAYSNYTFEVSVGDGENLYLQLQRDVTLNGDPIVHFENLGGVTGFCSAFAAGSFTGVACGDYIRKESSSVYQYYRVAEIRVNAGTPFTNGTVEGTVSDATVQYLLLETHDGPISTTDEPYRFFRKSYQQTDFFTSAVGTIDTSAYWIGRRIGTMFYLRDYGDMQPGEETEVINDHDGLGGSGVADLTFDRSFDSVYDPTNGYALKAGGTSTLLTIRRRLADNTVGTPSGVDNSGALLQYTINAPIGTMNDNDGLWVRLGLSSGALSTGDVTDVSTDNVWEIRDTQDTPLRTYDNKNVYLVARKFTIDGEETLVFSDGTMLALEGERVNNHLSVNGDLFLPAIAQWSVPFISTTTGKVDSSSEFQWDETLGPDGLGRFKARNVTISSHIANGYDLIDQVTPANVFLFPSIGSKTIRIGDSTSTTYIPGDLLVDGTTTAIRTSILQVDDKLISVGVGSIADGAYGAGIEAADDTRSAVSIDSVASMIYVDITYSSSHPYVLGSEVNVDANVGVGGITAGQLAGSYVVVNSGTLAGNAQVMSSTVLRVWTSGTAGSSTNITLNPPTTEVRTYTAPWSIRVGGSNGSYTSAVTSWVFRVKNSPTAASITPILNYATVPTAHSANMLATRIPFVGNDGAGLSGSDTTIDFSSGLTWDNTNNKLTAENLKISAGLEVSTTSAKTSDYNLTSSDVTVPFNTTGAVATTLANLPAATGSGRIYVIKDVGGQASQANKNILIVSNGSDTIDGQPDYLLFNDYDGVIIEDIAVGEWAVITKTGSGSGSGAVRVDLYDPVSTTLPSGPSAIFDGVSVADDDRVFFTNLATGNQRIYVASGVGVSLTWTVQSDFNENSETPAIGESVKVTRGSLFAGQEIYFNENNEFVANDTVRYFDGDKGTDFWEQSSIKTSNLLDNVSNNVIFSVNVNGSENMIIDYSIIRGSTEKQVGQLYLTSDGLNVSVTNTNTILDDVGVTFDADIFAGNVRLLYATTSTGVDAIMKYSVKRWSDSSGGPSGIPSYSGGGGGNTPAAGNTDDVQFKGNDGNLSANSKFKWDTAESAINLDGLLTGTLQGPAILLDDQATAVTIMSYSVSIKHAIFEYSVERDGEVQTGRLLVANNGTTISMSDDMVSTNALGILFSADISGGLVRLRYTSSATGFNSSFRYSFRRW